MQVHLIKSPDYPIENFVEVIDVLRSFGGPVNFVSSQIEFRKEDFFFLTREMRSRDIRDFDSQKKRFYFSEMQMPLSWKELFSLCHHYREAVKLPKEDFVILLTERMNTMNWFSMFEQEGNAFVHCGDWELFTDAPAQYPIAYEVTANVLRCLMKPDFKMQEEWFHEPPIGCMNDLCLQKSNVLLKLKTADICKDCHQKLIDELVHDEVIEQALQIFEGIRKQLLFRKSLKRNCELVPIKLNHQRRLVFPEIGNLEIKLTRLEMTLYVFYLLHSEGLRLNELSDHKNELLSLYRRFSVHDDDKEIRKRIASLVDPFSNSFSEKKSALNRKLRVLLGEEMGSHYTIKGEPGSAFCIGLAPEYIQIEEEYRMLV